jgi:peptidoglycan/xylan/chitin deacetylase (PgdA/CDA1 family)
MALTCHGAGEASLTRTASRIAAQHHATFTVLAVGSWLHQNPHQATAVRDGGHDLGNHSSSHLPMRQPPRARRVRDGIGQSSIVSLHLGMSAPSLRCLDPGRPDQPRPEGAQREPL